MTQLIALLRGINVGGHTRIGMAALCDLCQSLGYENARTYLQSGNVVFEADEKVDHVAMALEKVIDNELDLKVTVLLRTAVELKKVLNENPLLGGKRDPSFLHVTFLSERPTTEHAKKLTVPEGQTAEMELKGREVYLYCPDGYGRTKLNNTFIERRLGVSATTRNWKTVTNLVTMTQD